MAFATMLSGARLKARAISTHLPSARNLHPNTKSSRVLRRHATHSSVEPPTPSEEFEGLTAEEDFEVPGTYQDALNPQTKLGKAVKAACEEIEHLNKLEQEVMVQYNEKLKALGINLDIFTLPPQATSGEQEEGVQDEAAGSEAGPSDPAS